LMRATIDRNVGVPVTGFLGTSNRSILEHDVRSVPIKRARIAALARRLTMYASYLRTTLRLPAGHEPGKIRPVAGRSKE
jgi:hypothetical protein